MESAESKSETDMEKLKRGHFDVHLSEPFTVLLERYIPTLHIYPY